MCIAKESQKQKRPGTDSLRPPAMLSRNLWQDIPQDTDRYPDDDRYLLGWAYILFGQISQELGDPEEYWHRT